MKLYILITPSLSNGCETGHWNKGI